MKYVILLMCAIACASCGPQQPKESTLKYNALSWNFRQAGNLSFSRQNRDLIQRSMNVLSKRIDQSRIWNCARENTKKWKVQNSGQNITTTDRFKNFIRLHQRAFTSGNIPRVLFTPFRENGPAHGRAYVGGYVKAKFVSTTSLVPIYKFDGEFNVMLNLKHLSDRNWNDAETWAGTIFHEMLHQMGYTHFKGVYNDDMYITVIGDCVTNNGRYYSRNGFGLNGGRFAIPD